MLQFLLPMGETQMELQASGFSVVCPYCREPLGNELAHGDMKELSLSLNIYITIYFYL